jgi:hypothetical protein
VRACEGVWLTTVSRGMLSMFVLLGDEDWWSSGWKPCRSLEKRCGFGEVDIALCAAREVSCRQWRQWGFGGERRGRAGVSRYRNVTPEVKERLGRDSN